MCQAISIYVSFEIMCVIIPFRMIIPNSNVWGSYYVFSTIEVCVTFSKQHKIVVGDNWPQFHFRTISNSQILFSSETVIVIWNGKQGNSSQ